ncbi:hypothetical protein HBB16_02320, partial [Pseudonocardia sp. MCCB 268]|nr:hypothetical protein [Pseudonocardia cytotoxica]
LRNTKVKQTTTTESTAPGRSRSPPSGRSSGRGEGAADGTAHAGEKAFGHRFDAMIYRWRGAMTLTATSPAGSTAPRPPRRSRSSNYNLRTT